MIREVTLEDAPELIKLMRQLGYTISLATMQERIAIYKAWMWNNDAVIAVHILPLFHSEESAMRIVSFVVDEKVRNQGIGKKLLTFVEAKAREAGCTLLELTSSLHRKEKGAYAFYESLGFKLNQEKGYFWKIL
jgi:GNAT superfamily N-acetyltransferase